MTPEYLALVHATNPDGTPLLPGLRVVCPGRQHEFDRGQWTEVVPCCALGCPGYKPAEESLETVLMAIWAVGYEVVITHVSAKPTVAGEWLVARAAGEPVGHEPIDPERPLAALLQAALKAFGVEARAKAGGEG